MYSSTSLFESITSQDQVHIILSDHPFHLSSHEQYYFQLLKFKINTRPKRPFSLHFKEYGLIHNEHSLLFQHGHQPRHSSSSTWSHKNSSHPISLPPIRIIYHKYSDARRNETNNSSTIGTNTSGSKGHSQHNHSILKSFNSTTTTRKEQTFKLHQPTNIAISHQHECIIVSCSCNVIFFDLYSKLLLQESPLCPFNIKCLCVEMLFHSLSNASHNQHYGDALIVSCEDQCIYKFELSKLKPNTKNGGVWSSNRREYGSSLIHISKPIWKTGIPFYSDGLTLAPLQSFSDPVGLSLCYPHLNGHPQTFTRDNPLSNEISGISCRTLLYVCDFGKDCLKVLDTSNGKVIQVIDELVIASQSCPLRSGPSSISSTHHTQRLFQTPIFNPKCVQLLQNGHLLLFQHDGDEARVGIFRQDHSTLHLVKLLSSETCAEELYFHGQNALLVDQVSGNLLVCEMFPHRIRVYDPKNYSQLKCYDFERTIKDPKKMMLRNDLHSIEGGWGNASGKPPRVPTGMCLNEWTGELFVLDRRSAQVHIFV
ncbi:hypothetical protein C9374_005349 [Naegleria lovaniensis]|uniref:Uncharacterized protein n=1 Tax=Naegleria lovaniensis TaxID=51637 RepID=A0AA88GPS1_NAELO|nr:uncharacterized protein C9374_005349 [Naegleria lovaniensis]KAG2382147.1 hypothetical protein C9374_005349 [Naegleria lovaniensis]